MIQKLDNKLNGYLKDSEIFSGLSESLQEKLASWDALKKPIERLDWNTYFMAIAFLSSLRSPDGRTKVGCCIVDQNNTILTTAYNGLLRGVDERIFPNNSSDKYQYFLHSEENALLNLARKGQSSDNSIVYLTGPPCYGCIQKMYQAGISKVFHGNQYINLIDNQEYKDNVELFKLLTQNSMPLISMDFKIQELFRLF